MKEYRALIAADPKRINRLYREIGIILGFENVTALIRPKETYALLSKSRFDILILDPQIYADEGLNPEDVTAHRKRLRYRVAVLLPETPDDPAVADFVTRLNPNAEFREPWDGTTIAAQIPKICTREYIYRREPLRAQTKEKIMTLLRDCGFHTKCRGYEMFADAMTELYLDPSLEGYGGATAIYDRLAERNDATRRVVERSILRFLESSWQPEVRKRLFAALDIPDSHEPQVNFGDFSLLFNLYYEKQNGASMIYLIKPRKRYSGKNA